MPRQLAELLQLSVEEVCADFDAMLPRLEAPRHLRRGGARVLRRGRRRACSILGRGEADPAAHPRVEALRRRGRRQLVAVGESPKVAISSPAQYCGLRLRRGTRIRELPEEHEVLRQEYRGQRLAGLARKIFLKLLKAKREVPGAAERQKTLAAQDGKCALCGCGLTGTCELDRPRGAGEAGLCGQRANFAGAVRRLPQREDAARERAAHEFGEPRGPGVMEYVRSPKF